jgi:acyl transferase domain-containing protein
VKIVQALDDLEILKGLQVKADHTVRVSLQIDDGPVRVAAMDLTDANTNRVSGDLEPLFAAAPVEAPRYRMQRRDTPLARAKSSRRDERKWVNYHHIRARSGRDRPAYESPKGGDYWPRWLEDMYQDALAGRGNYPLPPSQPEDPGQE